MNYAIYRSYSDAQTISEREPAQLRIFCQITYNHRALGAAKLFLRNLLLHYKLFSQDAVISSTPTSFDVVLPNSRGRVSFFIAPLGAPHLPLS